MRIVRARALAEFPTTVGAVALALPLPYLGFAVAYGCAARFACYLGDGLCTFDCADPITQVPFFLIIGALVGLLPAGVATTLLLVRPWQPTERRIVRVGVPIACLAAAVPAFALVFNSWGLLLGVLSLPLAAGLLVAFNLAVSPEWRAAVRR